MAMDKCIVWMWLNEWMDVCNKILKINKKSGILQPNLIILNLFPTVMKKKHITVIWKKFHEFLKWRSVMKTTYQYKCKLHMSLDNFLHIWSRKSQVTAKSPSPSGGLWLLPFSFCRSLITTLLLLEVIYYSFLCGDHWLLPFYFWRSLITALLLLEVTDYSLLLVEVTDYSPSTSEHHWLLFSLWRSLITPSLLLEVILHFSSPFIGLPHQRTPLFTHPF